MALNPQSYSKGVLTIQDLLRSFHGNGRGGYLLGLTSAHHRPVYEGIAHSAHLEPWWQSYERLGINGETAGHTERFMRQITSEGVPVVFLVPRNLFGASKLSFTAEEMAWLLDKPQQRTANVYFAFGAYEMVPTQFVKDVIERNGKDRGTDILTTIIRGWQRYLLQ